jgi:hypothetical protein
MQRRRCIRGSGAYGYRDEGGDADETDAEADVEVMILDHCRCRWM